MAAHPFGNECIELVRVQHALTGAPEAGEVVG
jgi:hypothetical protein